MAYKVLATQKAEEDLDAIIQYMVETLYNPDAASSLLDKIEALYDRLSESPFIYALCIQPLLSAQSYRKAVIGGYVALYKVDGNTVYIERYFSDLEDYAKKL